MRQYCHWLQTDSVKYRSAYCSEELLTSYDIKYAHHVAGFDNNYWNYTRHNALYDDTQYWRIRAVYWSTFIKQKTKTIFVFETSNPDPKLTTATPQLMGSERRTCFERECVMALQGHPRSLILAPVESAYAISYLSSIVTLDLSCPVSEILQVSWEERPHPHSTRILGVFPLD